MKIRNEDMEHAAQEPHRVRVFDHGKGAAVVGCNIFSNTGFYIPARNCGDEKIPASGGILVNGREKCDTY